MKFNWGTGIFIFYTLFAGSLFFQVYKSTQYDNSLVENNYYEKDLAYQQQYEKKANSLALKQGLVIDYQKDNSAIALTFPKTIHTINGTVSFYRADDESMDVQLPITLNADQMMVLNSDKLAQGAWKVLVDWVGDEVPYFDETKILIES